MYYTSIQAIIDNKNWTDKRKSLKRLIISEKTSESVSKSRKLKA